MNPNPTNLTMTWGQDTISNTLSNTFELMAESMAQNKEGWDVVAKAMKILEMNFPPPPDYDLGRIWIEK